MTLCDLTHMAFYDRNLIHGLPNYEMLFEMLYGDFPRRVTDGYVVVMALLCYVFMDSWCQLFIREIGIWAKRK